MSMGLKIHSHFAEPYKNNFLNHKVIRACIHVISRRSGRKERSTGSSRSPDILSPENVFSFSVSLLLLLMTRSRSQALIIRLLVVWLEIGFALEKNIKKKWLQLPNLWHRMIFFREAGTNNGFQYSNYRQCFLFTEHIQFFMFSEVWK